MRQGSCGTVGGGEGEDGSGSREEERCSRSSSVSISG